MSARPHISWAVWHGRGTDAAVSKGGARAGGAFALYSLLKRQAGLGTGGRTAALDRLLKQYSTGPVRTGAAAASPRGSRQRAHGGSGSESGPRSGQGPGEGAGQGRGVWAARFGPGAPAALSAAARTSGTAQHDWRQRLIAVRSIIMTARLRLLGKRAGIPLPGIAMCWTISCASVAVW